VAASPPRAGAVGRPLAVTAVGWLFIAAGSLGIAYHAREIASAAPFAREALPILAVRLLAIAGGVFLLRGAPWARWLLVLWMLYHVLLSAGHSTGELVVHAALLGIVATAVFHPAASAYFRPTGARAGGAA
jgi:hypothetical protein